VTATLLLALTAGMLGAVNPCGFALLPAYLSVLVAGDRSDPASGGSRASAASGASPASGGSRVLASSGAVALAPSLPASSGASRAVGRALRCTAALTAGYVVVFGVFGLVLAPLTGWLMPRLPWLTVVFGLGLAVLGGWLLTGRSLPTLGSGMRAPRLTGTTASMVLFGMAYAIASLGCAIGPFLAIVVSSLRAGSIAEGVALFVSYAAGMGLVIGVTALAVALVRVSAVSRLRRAAAFVPRIGGAVLVVAGAYVAYYGWYELRIVKDLRTSGQDPVVNLASDVQRELSGVVGRVGAGWFVLVLAGLILATLVLSGRRRTSVGS
jgi:cytochrome c-type biogenesis protein